MPNMEFTVRSIEIGLASDQDVNLFFGRVAGILMDELRLESSQVKEYIAEYYQKFTDDDFCRSINIPTQDDDFFFHESEKGMALRIIYYTIHKRDPNPHEFIEWRSSGRKA